VSSHPLIFVVCRRCSSVEHSAQLYPFIDFFCVCFLWNLETCFWRLLIQSHCYRGCNSIIPISVVSLDFSIHSSLSSTSCCVILVSCTSFQPVHQLLLLSYCSCYNHCLKTFELCSGFRYSSVDRYCLVELLFQSTLSSTHFLSFLDPSRCFANVISILSWFYCCYGPMIRSDHGSLMSPFFPIECMFGPSGVLRGKLCVTLALLCTLFFYFCAVLQGASHMFLEYVAIGSLDGNPCNFFQELEYRDAPLHS